MFLLVMALPSSCKKYTCEILTSASCALTISRDEKRIEPVSTRSLSDFTEVHLKGEMIALTSDICKSFPNMKELQSRDHQMDEIEEDAFQTCKKLEYINFFNNSLKIKLKKNTFKGLVALTRLHYGYTNMGVLDVDMSDSKDLKEFVMSRLNLTVYRPEMLRENTKLERLGLYCNRLLNVDIELITKYAPNLKTIDLQDNNFKCSRLLHILAVTKSKNINARTFTFESRVKERDYKPDNVNGIFCLNDDQFQKEFTDGE